MVLQTALFLHSSAVIRHHFKMSPFVCFSTAWYRVCSSSLARSSPTLWSQD